MTKEEIRQHLQAEDFEPFEIVSSSGRRYPVKHPEFAIITRRGSIHIYLPDPEAKQDPEFIGSLSLLHITALEPLRENTSSSSSNGKH